MDTDLVKKATKTMINNSKYYRKGAYVALNLKKKNFVSKPSKKFFGSIFIKMTAF